MPEFLWILTLGPFVMVLVMLGSIWITMRAIAKLHDRYYRNRVWCVCRVNDRIGLCPRDVLEKTSRGEWKSERRRLKKTYRHPTGWQRWQIGWRAGKLIQPPEHEIIVVHWEGLEHTALAADHHFERAEFLVPVIETPMHLAYQKIHGRPWDGKYIH